MCKKVEGTALCGANSYLEKYYLNPEFMGLPEQVRKELQVMCVLFAEEVGGIITMEFAADGSLMIQTSASESDYLYDEIESGLRVRRLQSENEELFAGLENYYKIKFMGADPGDILAASGEEAGSDDGEQNGN